MAIRLALLAHHYRDDWEWTAGDLPTAEARLELWRRAVARDQAPPADELVAGVRRALADDLDAPAALAAIDRWAEQAVRGQGSDPDPVPRSGWQWTLCWVSRCDPDRSSSQPTARRIQP